MANFFDQFDDKTTKPKPEPQGGGNFFDQFDPQEASKGAYDQAVSYLNEKKAEARMYEGRAKAMREKRPTMTAIRDKATSFTQGWMPFFDEAIAGVQSVLPGGMSYEEASKTLEADRRLREAEATKIGTLPVIGDVTTDDVTKLAGGITGLAAAPMATPFKGQALLPQTGNMAVTGSLYGGGYGLGEGTYQDTWSDTLKERGANAGLGMAVGGVTGGVTPMLSRAAGNTYNYIADKLRRMPQQLSGLNKPEVDRLIRALRDDQLTDTQYATLRNLLGDEGMLLDMGPNMRGQANAIANMPGEGQTLIREGQITRNRTAPARIETDVTAVAGPRRNMIEAEEQAVQGALQNAAPHFRQFEQRFIPQTGRLAALQARIPNDVMGAARAEARARGQQFTQMVPGNTPDEPIEALTPQAWEYIRQQLQHQIGAPNTSASMGAALTDLDNQIRATIDTMMSPGNPAQSPWALGRAASGTGKQFAEGVDFGTNMFSAPKTHHPDLLARNMAQGSPTYQEGVRQAARADLADTMGDAATQFGPSGDKATRKKLWSPYAREKLVQLYGQDGADQIINRIDAESTFGRSFNEIMTNSQTAPRQAAQAEFPNPAKPGAGAEPVSHVTIPGMVREAGRRVSNAVMAGANEEKLRAMATNAARVLSATGMQRDAYFRGLRRYMSSKGLSSAQADRLAQAVEDLMLGSVPSSVDEASSRLAP